MIGLPGKAEFGDCDALCHEANRLLKRDGLLLVEPGHMRTSRAREIVEGAGLLRMAKGEGEVVLSTEEPNSEANRR